MHFDVEYHLVRGHDMAAIDRAAERAGHRITVAQPAGFDPAADLTAWFQKAQIPPIRVRRQAWYETGFFSHAAHLDRVGLWSRSSFHSQAAMDQVRAYSAPARAQAVLAGAAVEPSKYTQPSTERPWHGVVLGTQVSRDHSVTTIPGADGHDAYWRFARGACAYYRKNLFIKLHPKLQGTDRINFTALAGEYGCTWGDVGMKVLDKCRFLLVYTSGLAVDAWLRGVPVAQFAPGYFSDTGAVTFTMGEYPDELDRADTAEMAQKMCDFLIWKYCYYQDMPPEAFVAMLEAFACAPEGEAFPLPEELSYAAQAPLAQVPQRKDSKHAVPVAHSHR